MFEYQLWCYYWEYWDNQRASTQHLVWRLEGFYNSLERAKLTLEQLQEYNRHPAIKDYRILKVEMVS
jgi:hypothetical protein